MAKNVKRIIEKEKKEKDKKIARQRIEELFRLAKSKFSKDAKLANRYVDLARKIGMKSKVRLTKEQKRLFCHNCHFFLMPGFNSRVRVTGKTLTYFCSNCKKYSRMGYKIRK